MDRRLILSFSEKQKNNIFFCAESGNIFPAIIAYQIGCLFLVNFCEILERQCSDCTACTLINDVIAGAGIRGVSHIFPYIRELQSNRVEDDRMTRLTGI